MKGYEWLADSIETIDFKKVKKMSDIANHLDISPAQLSILWCLKNTNVSSVILGASKVSQLKENLDALDYYDLITRDIMDKINKNY